MANRKIEVDIERLSRLRESGPDPSAAAELRKALNDRVGLVVAKAAKVAAELQMRELLPELVQAFDRLFEKGAERDPQCWAKNAIAKALMDLDYRQSAPFLRGVRYVQMEPVWAGQEDTASALRGICVLGLVTCSDVRRDVVLRCLVDALTERAQTVRVEAVRALAEMGGDESPLLLRLKARAGDVEPPVVGQVFDSLLRLEGAAAVPFLADFLDGKSADVQAEAALALGSSRLPEAVEALEDAWSRTRDPDLRDALVRAISAARQERGFEFLLNLVKNGRAAEASAALDALTLHRESPEIWRRVRQAVEDGGTAVQNVFRNLTASGG
jgi:HEAT repeat protein